MSQLPALGTINLSEFFIHLFNNLLLNSFYGLSTILEGKEGKTNTVLSLVEERDGIRQITEQFVFARCISEVRVQRRDQRASPGLEKLRELTEKAAHSRGLDI